MLCRKRQAIGKVIFGSFLRIGAGKMPVILKAEGIEKQYGNEKTGVHALRGIDLEIEEGRFYAIIGKSGSGKSTLLHILGGLDKPTKGAIFLEGENISALRGNALALVRRRRIGFVFQSYNLLEEHTVMENILLPIHLDGRVQDVKFVDQVVDALGIRDKLSSYPDELSGGQKQRVAIARALAPKPAILLADEPTGNLDDKTSREVMELLGKSAREFGQTMVLVTHDREIASQADRVVTIADGRIQSIQEGKYGY
jgi:ABC-type antimicrobial peptide transport system, ATPase component